MTIGQLIDAVLLEAAERGMTVDGISIDRIRKRIAGITFTFSERDAHAAYVVTREEIEDGTNPAGIARYVCGFAGIELAKRLYDTPAAHAPRFMDS